MKYTEHFLKCMVCCLDLEEVEHFIAKVEYDYMRELEQEAPHDEFLEEAVTILLVLKERQKLIVCSERASAKLEGW